MPLRPIIMPVVTATRVAPRGSFAGRHQSACKARVVIIGGGGGKVHGSFDVRCRLPKLHVDGRWWTELRFPEIKRHLHTRRELRDVLEYIARTTRGTPAVRVAYRVHGSEDLG